MFYYTPRNFSVLLTYHIRKENEWGIKDQLSPCLHSMRACEHTHRCLCACTQNHKMDPGKKIITSQGYSWFSVTGNYVRAGGGGGGVKKKSGLWLFTSREIFWSTKSYHLKFYEGWSQTSATSANCSFHGHFNNSCFQWPSLLPLLFALS